MISSILNQRYRVESKLGQGGMGVVYHAYDVIFRRDVAIKMLPPTLLHDAISHAKFRQEAEIIAALDHIAIVPVYDFGEHDDQPYLVMRLMRGGSLADRLKLDQAVAFSDVLDWIEPLAEALEKAHRQGVVHRDLKPENILFDLDNHPAIADFGLARLTSPDKASTSGAIVGTFAYMSPEQLRSEHDIDGRADIYALGILLYRMLAAQPPFTAFDPVGYITAHLHSPIPDICEVNPALPPACSRIIRKALAKDRRDRYPSAVELASDLRSALSREPLFVGGSDEETLPTPLTPFIGRAAELAEIASLLANPDCRLLTVVGPGGIGKTRLAIEAARAAQGDFLHGVWFVPLQSLESSIHLLPALADAIHFRFYDTGSPRQQILDYLREKRMLLVLDNFEHLLDGAELLADLLQAAPNLVIIVTSREVLHLEAEYLVEVGGMHYPDTALDTTPAYSAIALFTQRAQRVMASFALNASTAPDILRICRLVRGLPLAIEIAAAWVRVLPLHEIAAEIERSITFLEINRQDISERHRSIQAVFEQSWQLLSEDQRGVCAALSVFRGGFTRDAAFQIAGVSLPALRALVDKSLISHEAGDRYAVHELLRQFANRKLAGADASYEAAHAAHCLYYTQFVQAQQASLYGGAQKRAVEAMAAEIDNIRAAWQWAVQHRLDDQLDVALEGIWRYHVITFQFQHVLAAFIEAAESLRSRGASTSQTLLCRLTAITSYCAHEFGQAAQAGQWAEEGLVLARSAGMPREQAMALFIKGRQEQNLTRASELLHEALILFRQAGYPWGESRVLRYLGTVAQFTVEDSFQTAIDYVQAGIEVAEAMGDIIGFGSGLAELGHYYAMTGDAPGALRVFEQAREAFSSIDARFAVLNLNNNAGSVQWWLGNYAESERLFNERLRVSLELGSPSDIGLSYCLLGILNQFRGDSERSQWYYSEALSVEHGHAMHTYRTWCLAALGNFALERGDIPRAREYAEEAYAVALKQPDHYKWQCWTVLAKICLAEGTLSAARDHFATALSLLAANSIKVYLLISVAEIPALMIAEHHLPQAVELLAALNHNPVSPACVRDWTARQLADLRDTIPHYEFHAAIERGHQWDYEQIVTETRAYLET